ncbi:MAG: Ig-like domain-containing protein, partial [Gemmatimonadales bacterium]
MLRRLSACAMLFILACANSGDPPGGPPDTTPPTVVAIDPDSGVILSQPPSEATIIFDKVVDERIVGTTTDFKYAVILSPDAGATRVSWRRDRLTVRPRNGFKPGRVYRVELLPVVTDLRKNRLRIGKVIVFSTGPEIPSARVQGSIVDWVGGKPVPRALVEALLLPDSLSYRTLADSSGGFTLGPLPPGHYVVYGVMDTNGDRRRGAREAFDSSDVALDTAATLELFAFVHDSSAPRLRQVEGVDSLTLRLTFDRPLDPSVALDTSDVKVAPLADSTASLPLVGIYTPKQLDSLNAALRAVRAARDSAAAAARQDSLAAARRADTSAARRNPPSSALRPTPVAPPAQIAPGRITPAARSPLDSTRAEKMLARRPPPSDTRLVRLVTPLEIETRYVIHVFGVTSLTRHHANVRAQYRPPRPPPPPPSRARSATDSTHADSTARDTARVRRYTIPAPRDTTRPRRDTLT